VDYGTWRERRLLIATEGNTVDHEAIRRKIHELARTYRIRELAYDRWNSSMLINQLVNDGLNCVPVAQSNGAMNAPARELERVIAAGRLRHGANPICVGAPAMPSRMSMLAGISGRARAGVSSASTCSWPPSWGSPVTSWHRL
jgi:hypothetical protein